MIHSNRTTFGIYEFFRIIIPGFYFTSLLFLLMHLFLNRFLTFEFTSIQLLLLFFLFLMTSSFTMYAKETTKRRKAFIENLPSSYIQQLARKMPTYPPLEEVEARQIYFYILNNYIPAVFHEKIFYFGSIYHIMIQTRRTSFWFALISILCIVIQLASGCLLIEMQGLIMFSIFVWFIYLLNVRYNKADRKMQENYRDQIFWLQLNQSILNEVLNKYYASKMEKLNG